MLSLAPSCDAHLAPDRQLSLLVIEGELLQAPRARARVVRGGRARKRAPHLALIQLPLDFSRPLPTPATPTASSQPSTARRHLPLVLEPWKMTSE